MNNLILFFPPFVAHAVAEDCIHVRWSYLSKIFFAVLTKSTDQQRVAEKKSERETNAQQTNLINVEA